MSSSSPTFLYPKILVTLLTLTSSSVSNLSLENPASPNFLPLLPTHIQQCFVVTLQSKYSPGFSTPKASTNYILSFSHISSTNQTSSIFSYSPTSIRFVPRWRSPCGVASISVDHPFNLSSSSFALSSTYQAFLETLSGILRKDEDYFIFYSTSPQTNFIIDSLFSTEPLASNVKNKVGIKVGSSKPPAASLYVTTCFYCAPGGNPLLLSVPAFSFPDHLTNFHGKIFPVSCPMLSKWIYQIRPSHTSPGRWISARGNYKFAFDHLMLKYNFSGNFFPSTGGGTGLKLSNGSWVGIVGDVLSGRADIGQAIGQIYHRNLVVAFTFPISYEWLSFTTGVPRRQYSWKSVYWPFEPLLWWLVIASSLLTLAFFVFLLKYLEGEWSIRKCFTYLLSSFLEQDARELDNSSPSRIIVAFWLLFSILVTTAYRSKLVSLLSFPVLEEPPKTFRALAESPDNEYQITLQYLRGAAYTLIKTSTNPTFQTIFRRMELEENDAKCFQNAIGSSKHICISWDRIADYVNHKNLSDRHGNVPLVKAPDTSCFIVVGLAFRKRAIFREKFDSVLSLATSMGLAGKWVDMDNEFVKNERNEWEKATNRTKIVYPDVYGGVQRLRRENLTGTFYLMVCGYLFGMLTFGGELFVKLKTFRLLCSRNPILFLFNCNQT